MLEWPDETVEDCLVPIALPATKIQARDYRQFGLYPIIDQGRPTIAGRTDDESGLITSDLPVIVFGDHTRALKYIDFPFVRGADGVQILKPKPEIEPRYFYYALRALALPSRGYNRHLKSLKEKRVAIPSDRTEQRQIARLLGLVDDAVAIQHRAIELWSESKRHATQALFKRGLRGGPQKETEVGQVPENWDVVPLGSLGRVGNGSTPKKNVGEYWSGGSFPWLTSAKVYERDIVEADQFVTAKALQECHLPIVHPGAILIAITGQGKTLGHCAVLRTRATVSQHLAYVATDLKRANPSFVRAYLETQYETFRQVGSGGGSTKGALTCAFLRSVAVPLPPTLKEQDEIVEVLDALDRKIELHQQKRSVLEDLFKVLLQKLMTGEIRIAELDLSVLETPRAAGTAA